MTDETQAPDDEAQTIAAPAEAASNDDVPAEVEAKPKAKRGRKTSAEAKPKAKRGRKTSAEAKPNAKGRLKGVIPGEQTPLNIQVQIAMETSRRLAEKNNGNSRERASRRRRMKAI